MQYLAFQSHALCHHFHSNRFPINFSTSGIRVDSHLEGVECRHIRNYIVLDNDDDDDDDGCENVIKFNFHQHLVAAFVGLVLCSALRLNSNIIQYFESRCD